MAVKVAVTADVTLLSLCVRIEIANSRPDLLFQNVLFIVIFLSVASSLRRDLLVCCCANNAGCLRTVDAHDPPHYPIHESGSPEIAQCDVLGDCINPALHLILARLGSVRNLFPKHKRIGKLSHCGVLNISCERAASYVRLIQGIASPVPGVTL